MPNAPSCAVTEAAMERLAMAERLSGASAASSDALALALALAAADALAEA